MKHLLIVFVAISLFSGCADENECADGSLETLDGSRYCVLEEGAECPAALGEVVYDGDVRVCSSTTGFSETALVELSSRFGDVMCDVPWREISEGGVAYCVLEDVPSDERQVLCPSTNPWRIENDWFDLIVCSDDPAGEISAVRGLYAQACEAADSAQSCDASHGCRFVDATDRATLEDDMCVSGTTGVCMYVMGELGNAFDCSYRTVDGVEEAVWTNSIFVAEGWENSGDTSDLGSPCRCFQ